MTDPAVDVRGLLERCTFPEAGTRIDCAVSGGADSLALLVLAVAAGCVPTAVHVDHGLRSGSAAEADVVAAVAERFGVPWRSVRVDVEPGPNLEARARAARHAALGPAARTGHTADDRAETVLLNLLRGAGPDGLAALGPSPRRPILGLRRSETTELCAALGIVPVRDPSNDDPRFRRNRIRHEVLPLLCEVAGRDVVPLIVRTGEHAGTVAELLGELAGEVDVTSAAALRTAPRPVAATAVRQWLRRSDEEGQPPDAATVERVLRVASGDIRATEVGRGRRVGRSAGVLRLEEPGGAHRSG